MAHFSPTQDIGLHYKLSEGDSPMSRAQAKTHSFLVSPFVSCFSGLPSCSKPMLEGFHLYAGFSFQTQHRFKGLSSAPLRIQSQVQVMEMTLPTSTLRQLQLQFICQMPWFLSYLHFRLLWLPIYFASSVRYFIHIFYILYILFKATFRGKDFRLSM